MERKEQPASPFRLLIDSFFISLQTQGVEVDKHFEQQFYDICFGPKNWSYLKTQNLKNRFEAMLLPAKDNEEVKTAIDELTKGIGGQFRWGQRQFWSEPQRSGSMMILSAFRELFPDVPTVKRTLSNKI